MRRCAALATVGERVSVSVTVRLPIVSLTVGRGGEAAERAGAGGGGAEASGDPARETNTVGQS